MLSKIEYEKSFIPSGPGDLGWSESVTVRFLGSHSLFDSEMLVFLWGF